MTDSEKPLIDQLSLAHTFEGILKENKGKQPYRLSGYLVRAVMNHDVERVDLPFVAVNRHGLQPSTQAAFKSAEECREYAEANKLSPETRDGRKLIQKYDAAGYAHGTTILDILNRTDR